MMVSVQSMPKVMAVWFQDLHRWDYGFFRTLTWAWPTNLLFPVGTVLSRKQIEVSEIKDKEALPIIEKISFGGYITVTDVKSRVNYKGRLFWAASGNLIYSKIRVKQGSLAIVPEELDRLAVSAEYPVYSINEELVNPTFLMLVLKSKSFLSLFEGLSHGGSTKTRIPPSEFERQLIPLPSLAEQKAIVARWSEAQDDIAAAKARVAAISLELEHVLLNRIGLKIEPPTSQRGAFALLWGNLERWDTFFYRKDFVALKHSLARINQKKLGDLAHFISRPWHHNNFPDGFFNYVEISSVNKEVGIFSSKIVGLKEAPSRATTLICTGDLIISTTRPYLGAIAIVPEAYNNHVCSSGFALVDSVDDTHVLKEYLLFFLKSQGGLKQMEQRMTGGLYPAITQDELEKIEIPIPTLAVQRQIMERVAVGHEEIAHEREAAIRITSEINAEIEALILGTKKVSDL